MDVTLTDAERKRFKDYAEWQARELGDLAKDMTEAGSSAKIVRDFEHAAISYTVVAFYLQTVEARRVNGKWQSLKLN